VEAEVRAHVVACVACAAYASDLELLHTWVASVPPAEPSANFDWRLRLRLTKADAGDVPPLFDDVPGPHLGWVHFAVSAAAAAVLVVAVGTHFRPSQPSALPESGLAHSVSAPASGAGRLYPVSDGTPIGPQPAPSYSYFMQESTAAVPVDSAQTAPGTPGDAAPR